MIIQNPEIKFPTIEELSIFKFKHVPKPEDRADTDFVAQRKSIKESTN